MRELIRKRKICLFFSFNAWTILCSYYDSRRLCPSNTYVYEKLLLFGYFYYGLVNKIIHVQVLFVSLNYFHAMNELVFLKYLQLETKCHWISAVVNILWMMSSLELYYIYFHQYKWTAMDDDNNNNNRKEHCCIILANKKKKLARCELGKICWWKEHI